MVYETGRETRKGGPRMIKWLVCTGLCICPMTASGSAQAGTKPIVIRGIPGSPASTDLSLAYQASFPNGSLESTVDKLAVGAMQPGDPGIPGSNPTIEKRPGAILVRVSRPVGLDPALIPSESVWATPVNFGTGTISRIRATFIAPVGPLPGGGFAMGVNAKTGTADDLSTDTRIAVTINVRPNFVVRLNVPFGAAAQTAMVLPTDVKNAIFSITDPQPFTLELTMNRVTGKGTAKLMVIDQVFTLPFDLADFRADSGPAITAVGPGIAVNANAPGQTASVQIRDFRIYATGDR